MSKRLVEYRAALDKHTLLDSYMPLLRQSASQLKGPRAYFTDWNRGNLARNLATPNAHSQVLRKLKALLLTKRSIVFAASDLASPIAIDILFQNPELLDRDPAFEPE